MADPAPPPGAAETAGGNELSDAALPNTTLGPKAALVKSQSLLELPDGRREAEDAPGAPGPDTDARRSRSRSRHRAAGRRARSAASVAVGASAAVLGEAETAPTQRTFNRVGTAICLGQLVLVLLCAVLELCVVFSDAGDVLEDTASTWSLALAWALLVLGLLAPVALLHALLLPPTPGACISAAVVLALHALAAGCVLSAAHARGDPLPANYALVGLLGAALAIVLAAGPRSTHTAWLLPRRRVSPREAVRIGPV